MRVLRTIWTGIGVSTFCERQVANAPFPRPSVPTPFVHVS